MAEEGGALLATKTGMANHGCADQNTRAGSFFRCVDACLL